MRVAHDHDASISDVELYHGCCFSFKLLLHTGHQRNRHVGGHSSLPGGVRDTALDAVAQLDHLRGRGRAREGRAVVPGWRRPIPSEQHRGEVTLLGGACEAGTTALPPEHARPTATGAQRLGTRQRGARPTGLRREVRLKVLEHPGAVAARSYGLDLHDVLLDFPGLNVLLWRVALHFGGRRGARQHLRRAHEEAMARRALEVGDALYDAIVAADGRIKRDTHPHAVREARTTHVLDGTQAPAHRDHIAHVGRRHPRRLWT